MVINTHKSPPSLPSEIPTLTHLWHTVHLFKTFAQLDKEWATISSNQFGSPAEDTKEVKSKWRERESTQRTVIVSYGILRPIKL